MNILTSKQVTYEYRNAVQTVRAVNGISCTFQQGHVYAIVGPSGSGKTTFLSLLAGLDVPTSGTIELDGESTEPTGNLDSENSRNIVGILQGLAHEGNRCVIIVTHDPAVAEVADVLLKMKDGKLIH